MRSLVALALLPALLTLVIACGDDDDDDGATESASPLATSPAATATEEPSPCPTASITPSATAPAPSEEPTPTFTGSTDPVEAEGPPVPPVATLYDVRYGCHDAYDRVVFDFRDNIPGYRIEYVDQIFEDATGDPIDIAGSAFLNVRFSTAQAHDDAGNSTYTGPREITPGLESVPEMEMAGDFEGYVTWGIGLPEELGFRVITLEDPFRVVIDIAHPE